MTNDDQRSAVDAAGMAEHAAPLTKAWLDHVVIGLNLCPFAKAVQVKNQIDYRVSSARDTDALLTDLLDALQSLQDSDPGQTDTILLIHPWVLQDFFEYNDFVGFADSLLARLGLAGIIQIASFHPRYVFADTEESDITNCTNRSPFPMLHLLRESSIDTAIAAMPDSDKIVERNLTSLRAIGLDGWLALQARMHASVATD